MEIPADYAQVNWQFGGDACPTGAEVTLGLFVGDFSGTPADAAEICRDAWVDEILPGQSDETQLLNTLVKFGPTATGPSGSSAGGGVGSAGTTAEVPNVAMLVQKITASGGRAGRGRMFVPGMAQALFGSDGLMAGGDPAIYDGFFVAFRNTLITADLIPVLLHGDTSPLSTPSPITSFSTQQKAATQRRRLRR